jgi:hypothetical protein
MRLTAPEHALLLVERQARGSGAPIATVAAPDFAAANC